MVELLKKRLPVAASTEESVVLMLDWFKAHRSPAVLVGGRHALLQRLLQRLEAEQASSQAQENRDNGISKVSRLFGESWAIATLPMWPTSRQGLSFPWKTLSDSLPPLI